MYYRRVWRGFDTFEQRSTLFNCLMDMAGANHTGNNHHGTGSRTNSLEPPGVSGGHDAKSDHHRRGSRDEEEGAIGALVAAAEQRRQRSIRSVDLTIFTPHTRHKNN